LHTIPAPRTPDRAEMSMQTFASGDAGRRRLCLAVLCCQFLRFYLHPGIRAGSFYFYWNLNVACHFAQIWAGLDESLIYKR
jgi:hypothetical protein